MSAFQFLESKGGFSTATDGSATVTWKNGVSVIAGPDSDSVSFTYHAGNNQWEESLTYNATSSVIIDRVVINDSASTEIVASFNPPQALDNGDSLTITIEIPIS